MYSCQVLVQLSLLLSILTLHTTLAAPADASVKTKPSSTEDSAKFVVISEDVIPDLENTTQKVIRVNPLDLPAVTEDRSGSVDSSLYKIQSLLPPSRSYVNSNHMRATKTRSKNSVDSSPVAASVNNFPIIRQLAEPKFRKPIRNQKKQLHFFYNQVALDGQDVSKSMQVHLAPGAYPVYYTVAKTNGRFGKFPIKGFRTPTEFLKYLAKNKVASLDGASRVES
ncbi:PREDICTED: uncharacterized protein LOC108358734 [Rhagoletis zephyria]|uniref:uncharacterized protein LOC108358734 n=1 Tax=Rhagoletis zephyria TaxID=28612 RepID=UPI00081158A2|nr:PREDICTED: uncharacterized protein LOC108358734 [Rhagoletis zephyria]